MRFASYIPTTWPVPNSSFGEVDIEKTKKRNKTFVEEAVRSKKARALTDKIVSGKKRDPSR